MEKGKNLIAGVTNGGELFFIDNKRVISKNVLEDEEERIIAGSDGDGVYIIENDKIAEKIGEDKGLMSPVILKVTE